MTARALPLALLAACAAPDYGDLWSAVEVQKGYDPVDVHDAMRGVIDGASTRVDAAFPGLVDLDLAQSLIDAHASGVDVRVIVDWDRREDVGVVALLDADVPVRLADGELTFYDFDNNVETTWTSEQVQMTHAFVVADTFAWVAATSAGDLDPRGAVWLSGAGEDIAERLMLEHNQVFGGTDATSATAFNNNNKSINDPRTTWVTDGNEVFSIHFGPQERLVKSVIDAAYSAVSTIRVMTEDLNDEGLARALQQKAEDGFDVEIIVGRSFGTASARLSAILTEQTPDVTKLQATAPEPLPTLVFVDFDRAPDGLYHRPRVLALTHPIWAAGRNDSGAPTQTDQYCDGTLMMLSVGGQDPTRAMVDLAELYNDARADAEEL